MQMSENEIYSSYMNAADKRKQIKILAQLNACEEDIIKQILVKGGRPKEEIYPPRRKRRTKAEMKEAQEAAEEKEEPQEVLQTVDDDECCSGAITGGEGDIDEYTPMKRYRSARELEDEPEDMTEHEKERLKNIRAIPMPVREIVQEEIGKLCEQILMLEKKHDALVDYLNGERVN